MGKKRSSNAMEQVQRLLAWTTYQDSLKDIDREFFHRFQDTVNHLQDALWIQVIIFGLEFLVLSLALFWGLAQIQNNSNFQTWGGGIALASLLFLGILLYRNPFKEIYRVILDMARIQIILQGYTRQLHQNDASFKQGLFADDIDTTTINQSLENIQMMMDNNLENLIQSLDDLHL